MCLCQIRIREIHAKETMVSHSNKKPGQTRRVSSSAPKGAKLLLKHTDLLRHMSKLDGKTLAAILNGVNDEVIQLLSQICYNLMHRNLDVNPETAERHLACHKKSITDLMGKSTSMSRKRKIVQNGGFIGTLLSVAIPSIISGISSLIASRRR